MLEMRFSTGTLVPGKNQMELAEKSVLLLMVLFGAAIHLMMSGSREMDLTPNGKDQTQN